MIETHCSCSASICCTLTGPWCILWSQLPRCHQQLAAPPRPIPRAHRPSGAAWFTPGPAPGPSWPGLPGAPGPAAGDSLGIWGRSRCQTHAGCSQSASLRLCRGHRSSPSTPSRQKAEPGGVLGLLVVDMQTPLPPLLARDKGWLPKSFPLK